MKFSLLLCFLLAAAYAEAQTVRFQTNLGNIDVDLLPGAAPRTVQNFMTYVNGRAYDNSIFHRSVGNFIIQGGGFRLTGNNISAIPQNTPVVNEFRESNVRGTLAMAKLDGDPNSATNQWFFNLNNNNAANLDRQNGGFTVFGRVRDAESLAVMDRIAAVPVPNPGPLPSPLDSVPLQNWTSGTPTAANYIIVQSITVLTESNPPSVSEGGVLSATAYGAYRFAAPGSYLEIYGENFTETTRTWGPSDFSPAGGAPTSLEGVTVTVGGQRAFVNFVSPNQVNVQVPSTVAINRPLSVVVTTNGGVSNTINLEIRQRAGGFLAPAAYLVGGRQFIYAARADGSAVTPQEGAAQGETIILFGTGFGAVSPFNFNFAGQIVPSDRLYPLGFPVTLRIGGQQAQIAFQGLAPGFVGLYQFNLEVPFGLTPGEHRVEATQANEAIAQELWLRVR
jgi:uncharacterized protein (TIGR03437 family)